MTRRIERVGCLYAVLLLVIGAGVLVAMAMGWKP